MSEAYEASVLPEEAAPLVVPVEVSEVIAKPRRLQVTTTRFEGQDGPYLIMTAQPGYSIERVILTDLDQKTKRCKVGVVTEKRKGRPTKAQKEAANEQAD